MKKTFVLFCALLGAAACAAPALAASMRVRQPAYGFEFEVERTADMPANWWKTGDGCYVMRRVDTNWVYGRRTAGGLVATDILVGSVDPHTVMGLGVDYRPEGLSLSRLPSSQEQGPVYTPPEPDAATQKKPWRSADWGKTKNPAYLGELKQIIKGLRVTQDDFKKVHVYSYPYLTYYHFPTRVPLDFYIVHQRETGHVELFLNVGVKARKTPTSIRFNFDGYEGEVYSLIPLSFESDGGFSGGREGAWERHREFWEKVADAFSRPLFWRNPAWLRGYGLRLASNKNSTTLPSPIYTSLMRKIADAEKVEIRLWDEGDFVRSGSDTRYKLREWFLGIFQIDEKNRFIRSMEARFETYRRLVDLEERWQGPITLEPQPQVASWPPDRPLRADLIYDIMEAGDFEALTSRLNRLFGEPQIQETPGRSTSRTGSQMFWRSGEHVRIGLQYLFEGGTWRRNQWGWVSSAVVEDWADARQAFDARVGEFTEMLGAPKVKKASEATWLIGDDNSVRFSVRLAGNSIAYTSVTKGLDHTVIEMVR